METTTKDKIVDELAERLLKLQNERSMAYEYGMTEAARALQSVITDIEDEMRFFQE
jgi:hypothetical protein